MKTTDFQGRHSHSLVDSVSPITGIRYRIPYYWTKNFRRTPFKFNEAALTSFMICPVPWPLASYTITSAITDDSVVNFTGGFVNAY